MKTITAGHSSKKHLIRLSCLLVSGCIEFGSDVSTTIPTSAEISRCRAEMYIDPQIEIEPQGFRLTQGIDDAIWFKFVAKTDRIGEVFNKSVVDSTKFALNFKGLDENSMPPWWDVATRRLEGTSVQLPKARFMKVGFVANTDGTLAVYIMWHET